MKKLLFLFLLCTGLASAQGAQNVKGTYGSGPPQSTNCPGDIGTHYVDTSSSLVYAITAISAGPSSTTCTWSQIGSSGLSFTQATGSVNPVTFGAKFDGKACFGNVDTITVTSGSNQVTCNRGLFTSTAADGGKQFTASNGCCGVSANFQGVALFPQVAMHICKSTDSGSGGVGIVNSTTANICKDSDGTAANASSNCSGATCIIAFATNDDTAITAAEAAWQTAGKCGSMNLPAGITAVLKGHFNNPGTSCLGMEPQADYTAEVDGEGIGTTVIGLFSGFDFSTASCPIFGTTSKPTCFFGYLEASVQNLQLNGFGLGNTAAPAATNLMGPGLGSQLSQVGCMAFGGSDANLIGFSFNGLGVRVWGPAIDGCGKVGGSVDSGIAKAYYCFFGDNLGAALRILNAADFTDFGCDYGSQGGTIILDQGGRYHGIGSNLFSCGTVANATGMYMGNALSTGVTILDGGRWNCTSATSNGSFQNVAGQKLILTGGTIIGGTSAGIRVDAGTVHLARDTNIASGLITGTASRIIIADGHSIKGTCTGVGTASQTLGLYGTGPNVTLTTCTSTTIGSGIPISGAATALSLTVSATAGGVNASSGVVTVLKNGGATTITCTIGTGTSCVDTTHSVAFADGDLISIQFTTQAADTLAGVKAQIIWQ